MNRSAWSVLGVGIAATCCLVLVAIQAEQGFQIECSLPDVASVVGYRYEDLHVPDIDSARSLVERHFTDFEIREAVTAPFNDSFGFRDPLGNSVAVHNFGLIRLNTVTGCHGYTNRDHEFDLPRLEQRAREYAASCGICDPEDLYVDRVAYEWKWRPGEEPQKSAPRFEFGFTVDEMPIISDSAWNFVFVWFDLDGNIGYLSFAKSSIVPEQSQVDLLPFEESLQRAGRQMSKKGVKVPSTVTGAQLAYYGRDGKLIPCWWVDTRSSDESRVRFIVDATSGDFVKITHTPASLPFSTK